MSSKQPGFIAAILLVLDMAVLNCVWYIFYRVSWIPESYQTVSPIVSINISWIVTVYFLNAYKLKFLLRLPYIFMHNVKCLFSCFAFSVLLLMLLGKDLNSHFIIKLFAGFIVSFLFVRLLYSRILRILHAKGYHFSRVLIAGTGAEADRLKNYIEKERWFGNKFLGFVENKQSTETSGTVYGGLSEMKSAILSGSVDEVYWTLPEENHSAFTDFINLCEANMVRLHLVPPDIGSPVRNLDSTVYDGIPVMSFREEPLRNIFNKFLKRSFDVVVSSLILVFILSWLIPIMCILIKLTSKGPIFFVQDRTGENNKTFRMWKFRSMYVNDESDSKACQKNDPRITPIGKFLRMTHIDEFPQFFHTLTGSMSIVGPRPHMTSHTEEYSKMIDSFMVRHLVKPGITGWAQVNGFRGTISTIEDMKGRVRFDVWYIENWNLWIDIKVCLKTFLLVFGAVGKHEEG